MLYLYVFILILIFISVRDFWVYGRFVNRGNDYWLRSIVFVFFPIVYFKIVWFCQLFGYVSFFVSFQLFCTPSIICNYMPLFMRTFFDYWIQFNFVSYSCCIIRFVSFGIWCVHQMYSDDVIVQSHQFKYNRKIWFSNAINRLYGFGT